MFTKITFLLLFFKIVFYYNQNIFKQVEQWALNTQVIFICFITDTRENYKNQVGFAYIRIVPSCGPLCLRTQPSYMPDVILGGALYSALPTKRLTNHIAKYITLQPVSENFLRNLKPPPYHKFLIVFNSTVMP